MPVNYEALFDAYKAVKEDNMSISAAARRFGVPTLGDRINGVTDLPCMSFGQKPIFSEEQELALSRHLIAMADLGYGYSRREVMEMASEYAVRLGLREPNNPLGKNWFGCFMRRWPNIKARKMTGLDTYRAKASSAENVRKYFDRLEACLQNHGLKDKPAQMYNIDEKALTAHHQPPRQIGKKKGLCQAVVPPRGSTTTLIGAGSAIGHMIPPFFVFKGVRLQPQYLKDACVGSSGCMSDSGWSNSTIFAKYLKEHFLKYAQRPSTEDPLLVVYDGHKSHVTLDVLDWATVEHNVVLFVLPAHTSHFLQPLDVGCFGPLEAAFIKMKHARVRGHQSGNLGLGEVAELASKANQEAMKAQNLISSFRKCGISPFGGMAAIDPERLVPATVFAAENNNDQDQDEEEGNGNGFKGTVPCVVSS